MKTDGTVWCWGQNWDGELGDGTTADRITPVQVQGLSGAAQVAVSEASSCALCTDGTVWCWGDTSEGQLGGGTRSDRPSLVRAVGLSGVTQISAGEYRWSYRVCAVRQNGAVWFWGDATGVMLTPTRVAGLTGGVQVTAGHGHECARLGSGSLRCWGLNGYGQLGVGTTVIRPVSMRSTMTNAMAVTAGGVQTCAVTSRQPGQVLGRQLGGSARQRDGHRPAEPGCCSLSAGASCSCAVLTDGTMRCWSLYDTAQLGNGTRQNSSFPSPVLR